MAQGVERQFISLFQMTLIILPIVQVPITKGTLRLNSDSSVTMRNTTSLSYLVISLNCMCRIMNPSRLVYFLPNPTRFNGWLTKSTSGRTGNLHCCMKVGMIVFTRLPLSAKAWTFLPSIVKSTSISGLIQGAVGPPMTSSGSQLHSITQTLTSGHWFEIFGAGRLFLPTPLVFNCSWCHLLKALQCGQSLAKWPDDPHTKHFCSSL